MQPFLKYAYGYVSQSDVSDYEYNDIAKALSDSINLECILLPSKDELYNPKLLCKVIYQLVVMESTRQIGPQWLDSMLVLLEKIMSNTNSVDICHSLRDVV